MVCSRLIFFNVSFVFVVLIDANINKNGVLVVLALDQSLFSSLRDQPVMKSNLKNGIWYRVHLVELYNSHAIKY